MEPRRRGQVPWFPFFFIFAGRQQHITRMPRLPQPADQFYQIGLGHGGAPSRGPIDSAPDVKKYGAARSGHRWIGIMPNLHQPAVSKIVVPHLLLCKPRRRIRRIGNRDKTIVIRTVHVIAPGVGGRYLMKGIIRALGQFRIISKDLPDPENPGWRSPISFLFLQSRLVLTSQASAPGDALLPNNTENGPATAFQSPPRGRSNNRNSPRIESQVGAMATIN